MGRGLRPRENCLEFPADHAYWDPACMPKLKPARGAYAAVLYPPREVTEGGIHLRASGSGWSERRPEHWKRADEAVRIAEQELLLLTEGLRGETIFTPQMKKRLEAARDAYRLALSKRWRLSQKENHGAAFRYRPDCAMVASVGDGVQLEPGDRVMVAPFAGHRFESFQGWKDYVIYGRERPWLDVTPLIMGPDGWEPLGNWYAIAMTATTGTVATKHPNWHNWGIVLQAGPDCSYPVGTPVVTHKDRLVPRWGATAWFWSDWGPYPDNVLFVREEDSGGTRRVLGTLDGDISIEESAEAPTILMCRL